MGECVAGEQLLALESHVDPKRGVEHVRCERGWLTCQLTSPDIVALGTRRPPSVWDDRWGGDGVDAPPPPLGSEGVGHAPSTMAPQHAISRNGADAWAESSLSQTAAAQVIQSELRHGLTKDPVLAGPISFSKFLARLETDAAWQQATGLGAPPP